MDYKFYCLKCKKDVYIDIPMKEYSYKKGGQKCPDCGSPVRRVYEWTGCATGSGEGWFGKNGGNTI